MLVKIGEGVNEQQRGGRVQVEAVVDVLAGQLVHEDEHEERHEGQNIKTQSAPVDQDLRLVDEDQHKGDHVEHVDRQVVELTVGARLEQPGQHEDEVLESVAHRVLDDVVREDHVAPALAAVDGEAAIPMVGLS